MDEEIVVEATAEEGPLAEEALEVEEEMVEGEGPSLSAVLESRAAFYETLASLYFQPLKQDQIDAMAQQDFTVYADINQDFADGVNDITRFLRKRHSGTRQDLAVDFTGAFVGTATWEGRYAVPFKSVFTSDEGLMYQEGYREVYDAYKQEAVKKRDGLDWPDDHLSFMFQFMALLSRRTEAALAKGSKTDALHDLRVSQEFLTQHIASWFDDFFELAMKLMKTRFYRGVLKITRGYIAFDQAVLKDLIEEVEARG